MTTPLDAFPKTGSSAVKTDQNTFPLMSSSSRNCIGPFQADYQLTKYEGKQAQDKTSKQRESLTEQPGSSHSDLPTKIKTKMAQWLGSFGSIKDSAYAKAQDKLQGEFAGGMKRKLEDGMRKKFPKLETVLVLFKKIIDEGKLPSFSHKEEDPDVKESTSAPFTFKNEMSENMASFEALYVSSPNEAITLLESIPPEKLTVEFCDGCMQKLDNASALKFIEGLISKDVKTAPGRLWVLEKNSLASKFIASFQKKMMPELPKIIEETLKEIQDKRKSAKAYDLKTNKGQELFLADLKTLLENLPSAIQAIRPEIKQMNQYIRSLIGRKFSGDQDRVIAQQFVSGYLYPLITNASQACTTPILKKNTEELAKFIQIVSEYTYEDISGDYNFESRFKQDLSRDETPLAALFKKLVASL